MADGLSYGDWPWPPRRFREELAHNLSNFIRDEGEKYQSLGPESAISSDNYKSFVACIYRYINDYIRDPPTGSVMFRRWQESDDGPFTAVGAGHVTNNPIAYMPQDGPTTGDPGEQIRQYHNDPGFYNMFNQGAFANPRGKNVIQQVQSVTRVFGASDFSTLYPDELPSAGSSNHAAGNETVSIDSHYESTSKRRNREITPLDENSSTMTLGSHRSKRVDAGTDEAKKSEFKHKCHLCGLRFQFPARLKSHMETATHTRRRHRCQICNVEFTRQSSLTRHQIGDTACKGLRRANGNSTLGSISGVQSVFHASAGSPSYTQDDIAPTDSSADPTPGNRQRPPVPDFYPSSTNPRTTSRRNYPPPAAHVPSQLQDGTITQSSLSPQHKFIDPMMLGNPTYHGRYGEEYLNLGSSPS